MQTAFQGAGAFRSPQSFQSTAFSQPRSPLPPPRVQGFCLLLGMGELSSLLAPKVSTSVLCMEGYLPWAWGGLPSSGSCPQPNSSLSRHLSGAFCPTESLPWYRNSPREAWIPWTQNSDCWLWPNPDPRKTQATSPQTAVEETQRPQVVQKPLKKLNTVSLQGVGQDNARPQALSSLWLKQSLWDSRHTSPTWKQAHVRFPSWLRGPGLKHHPFTALAWHPPTVRRTRNAPLSSWLSCSHTVVPLCKYHDGQGPATEEMEEPLYKVSRSHPERNSASPANLLGSLLRAH